jgi:DNA (cytosine-5)-methyltransferase 1
MPLRFIDLFAGLGGFHIALESLGCKCVFASELKEDLQNLYKQNFNDTQRIEGDITKVNLHEIPAHDILCAGFPCQPFSQAGKRMGFDDEGRGNMFDYICKVIELQKELKPSILLLENVANLRGHDEGRTWRIIQEKLDALGYWVKGEILSPHQYGYPQHRKRMYIVGVRKDKGNLENFQFPIEHKESHCDIREIIDPDDTRVQILKPETIRQLKVWQNFVSLTLHNGGHLPQFPVWAMEFGADYPFETCAPRFLDKNALIGKHGKLGTMIEGKTLDDCISQLPVYAQSGKKHEFPKWKIKYIQQNRTFYELHHAWIDNWIGKIRTWDNSFQKFEWNCGSDDNGNIFDKIIQFRASGIRVKLPTYSPALNLVGTQIPILPWVQLPEPCIPQYTDEELFRYGIKRRDITRGRYLSVREAARLQGMEDLDFNGLSNARIYEALGNAVNTQVVKKIARRLINIYKNGRN